jgi:hypothetical protein
MMPPRSILLAAPTRFTQEAPMTCNQEQGFTATVSRLLADPRVIADISELMAKGPVTSIMIRECGWCREYLGVKEGNGAAGITSGICLPCGLRKLPAHLHDDFRKQHGLEPIGIGKEGGVI